MPRLRTKRRKMKEDRNHTIDVAQQLLFNIYREFQTAEVVWTILDIKEAVRNGNLKPLLKAIRSVRRDITQIINELKDNGRG